MAVESVTVTFIDTCETKRLNTKTRSSNHFFARFLVGADEIQLRLDWSCLDGNGHPTLDADFINPATGGHRKLKGERRAAHHTKSLESGYRCYQWAFKDFCRQFYVAVSWRDAVVERAEASDSCSAVLIKGNKLAP